MKIIALFLCIPVGSLYSQLLEDRRHHELLLHGIRYTLEQQYDSAETSFTGMIAAYPEHPSGYVYLAGMLQARYTDYGHAFNAKRYDSLLTAAGTLAQSMINKPATSAWGYYYAGLSDAFRSFTASENGNLPIGFYYGISAGRSLEQCLARDSTFHLAKNILGSYYFWRSKLAWIPLITDKTDEGIRLIIEAINHPYEKHLASHNLMLIFIDEKRYAEAEYHGEAMLALYPNNRSFLWNMVTVYEQWGKEKELMTIVGRLLNSALNAPVVNRYTEATCRIKLAHFAYRQNDHVRATDECRKILQLKPYIGRTKGDLKKKIAQAEELLELINGR